MRSSKRLLALTRNLQCLRPPKDGLHVRHANADGMSYPPGKQDRMPRLPRYDPKNARPTFEGRGMRNRTFMDQWCHMSAQQQHMAILKAELARTRLVATAEGRNIEADPTCVMLT